MITFGSLFAGIGGFDLGFERAGMACKWQLEIGKQQSSVLSNHFPGVPNYGDVTKFTEYELPTVDVICGGDPCPRHSRARTTTACSSPDLSGYFLAVVGGLRPRWVVRENVLASTVEHFDVAMAALGYGTIIIRLDSAQATCQSRKRDFIIGCFGVSRAKLGEVFSDAESGAGAYASRFATQQVVACLTTRRQRYDSRDNYVYESAGFRILGSEERERFGGFPTGWTTGFSETTRAMMMGNAIVPQVAQFIGEHIMEVEESNEIC